MFLILRCAQGPWDQTKFEQLLTEWIVACDQPFEEVERPEFHALLTYMHHPSPTLHILGCSTIKWQVMEMRKDVEASLHETFAVSC